MSAVAGRVDRDEEDYMLATIPEQAWNLAIDEAPRTEIIRAIRNHSLVDLGLLRSVRAADKIIAMLGMRARGL